MNIIVRVVRKVKGGVLQGLEALFLLVATLLLRKDLVQGVLDELFFDF